jgi:chemotaxis protein CheX
MNLDGVNAIVQAAGEVLLAELGGEVQRGQLALVRGGEPTDEVTTLIRFQGGLSGIVLVTMSRATALRLASRLMGQEYGVLDEVAQSGIAELSNVIAGNAMSLLARQGYVCTIAPPRIAVIDGGGFATLTLPRLAIPLHTALGDLDLQVALTARPQAGGQG